jgi:membrane-associated phospholipid phosphatase
MARRAILTASIGHVVDRARGARPAALRRTTITIVSAIVLGSLPAGSDALAAAAVSDTTRADPAPPGRGEQLAHVARTLIDDAGYIVSAPARLDRADPLKVAGVLAITSVLAAYDQEILDAFNRNHDELPLRPLLEVGRFLDPIGYGRFNIYTGSIATIAWLAGQDRIARIGAEIVEAHLLAGIGKTAAIHLVGRTRPFQGDGPYEFFADDATSFPSGHTINIFEIATILSHHVDRGWFTWLAYGAAGCVGLQRVEADAHWASDVFLSALYGTAVARAIVERHEPRAGPALAPHASAAGIGAGLAWRF